MNPFNPLLIACSIRSQFPSIPDCYFTDISGQTYFKMFVGRNKYASTIDEEGAEYMFTSSGVVAPVALGKFTIQATIEYPNQDARKLVEQLRRNALSNNRKQSYPIEILDFCELHVGDDIRTAPDGQLYAHRLGRLFGIESKGSGIGGPDGLAYSADGFSFKFQENRQRILG